MLFAVALPAARRRGGLTARACRAATVGLAMASQISLSACAESAEANDASVATNTPNLRNTTAAPVVALSDFENATYTTLAVDRAGAIHAAWVDRVPGRSGPRLLYRASRDGGRTWSAIADLSDGQPAGFTGIPHLVADGAGRVYAVWKVINAGGTLVFDEEKPGLPAYGTLAYRVLEGGRWSGVGTLGNPQGVLSWYAADDARGRVHVVWSETPDEFTTFTVPSNATLVRQAVLDGARGAAPRVVVRGAGAGGYTGLNGYIDAQGTPHWIAVRAGDASSRYTLVHWSGAAEQAIGDLATVMAGYEEHTLPQLVTDAAGRERVILYNGVRDGPGILDIVPGQRQPQGVPYQPRNRGRIENFQVSRGPGGRVVTTVQVKGEGGSLLTDLFASELDGTAWSAPVKLTNNAAGGSASGVVDAAGRSLGNTKAWYAVHASVAYDQSGAPVVLMTNRETSTNLDVRPGGSVSALGRSRVFFARPAGLTNVRTVARAPAPTPEPVPGGDQRGVPNAGTTKGTTPSNSGTSNSSSSASIEQRFARYDITESGTLSGTELDACKCRQYDANRDGWVSRAEYIAGEVLAESGLPPLGGSNARPSDGGSNPSPGSSGTVVRGRYTCYTQSTRQSMPWEPGYGNVAPAPIATSKYLFYVTVEDGGNYQYLNRGRGTYRADDAGTITWLSGPFSGSGIRAAVKPGADGRPVMYLELEGTRAACLGPAR